MVSVAAKVAMATEATVATAGQETAAETETAAGQQQSTKMRQRLGGGGSATAATGFNELRGTVVSCPIFIRLQSLIAR